jgi:hypothetical protein
MDVGNRLDGLVGTTDSVEGHDDLPEEVISLRFQFQESRITREP